MLFSLRSFSLTTYAQKNAKNFGQWNMIIYPDFHGIEQGVVCFFFTSAFFRMISWDLPGDSERSGPLPACSVDLRSSLPATWQQQRGQQFFQETFQEWVMIIVFYLWVVYWWISYTWIYTWSILQYNDYSGNYSDYMWLWLDYCSNFWLVGDYSGNSSGNPNFTIIVGMIFVFRILLGDQKVGLWYSSNRGIPISQ